jgi:hypothetical protein
MSSSSDKLQRKLNGPSIFEIIFGATLSIFIGGILAAGYLAAQPVDTVRVMPREPDPDKVYYVTGSARSSQGKGWLRKKQMLNEPGAAAIELSEDELNTWLSSLKKTSDDEGGLITTRTMNLRIADGQLQVGLPCQVNLFGHLQSFVVQTRGGFVSDGDQFVYSPDEVMVGQLAAHRLPLVGGFVAGRLAAKYEVPEDLSTVWGTLSEVNIAENKLNLIRN